jgi:hypothetical protein
MSSEYFPEIYYEQSAWDKRLLEIYPYCCVIRRGVFDDAVEYVGKTCVEDSFTFKYPKFFFKNEKDAIWFHLKWC